MKQIIKDLKSNKSVGRNLPTNILKECKFTFSVLADCINKSFETDTFLDCLKGVNVTPVLKKIYSYDQDNSHSVNIAHCSLRPL